LVRVEGFFGENGAPGQFNALQEIVFDDYTSMDFAAIFALAKTNAAPVLQTPLAPVETQPGKFFEWYMPGDSFGNLSIPRFPAKSRANTTSSSDTA
jgi:hypothetical protein